jgi:hypothetical protein
MFDAFLFRLLLIKEPPQLVKRVDGHGKAERDFPYPL